MSTFKLLLGCCRQFENYLIVFSGQGTRAVLGLLMGVIIARLLGPEGFGLFSLFVAIIIIGSNLLGEGINTGVVRYYARYAVNDQSRANQVLVSALYLRFLLGVPVCIIGWFCGDFFARMIFQNHAYSLPITLGLVGSFTAALWSFVLTGFQATQNFRTYALLIPLVNILRIASVPVLIILGHFTLTLVLELHVAFFLMSSFWGFWILRHHFVGYRFELKNLRDQWHFSKWTAMGSLFFILQSYMAMPVLSYFTDAKTTGIYSAGLSLLLVIDQITITILTVQFPGISKLKTLFEYKAYVRRYLPISSLIALGLVPSLFFGRYAILFIYGAEFEPSVGVFHILFLGFLVTLVSHPLSLIFYAMNRPQVGTITSFTSLVGWLISAGFLIPSMGAIGAAWAMLISRIIQGVVITGFLLQYFSRQPEEAIIKSP